MPQVDSRHNTGQNSAAGAAYPRQMTFEIREDVISSERSGLGSSNNDDIQVESSLKAQDVTSETKTMV